MRQTANLFLPLARLRRKNGLTIPGPGAIYILTPIHRNISLKTLRTHQNFIIWPDFRPRLSATTTLSPWRFIETVAPNSGSWTNALELPSRLLSIRYER